MKEIRPPGRLLDPAPDNRTVRERTLAHLENLMRAAAVTVGGMLLASGSPGQEPQRPIVPDPPPPPPPDCCVHPDQLLIQACVKVTAVWARVEQQWILRLTLISENSPVTFDGLTKADIRLSGITLKELDTQRTRIAMVLAPVGAEKSPNLEFQVTCFGRKVPLKLSLDLSEGRSAGRNIPVRQVK